MADIEHDGYVFPGVDGVVDVVKLEYFLGRRSPDHWD